jgi:signal transduction histidine kinase
VAVELTLTGSFDAMPRATQLGAYRIVQEGLTNALKHAPGSLVQVRVSHADNRLTVAVESSGGSHGEPDANDTGFGLESLRARVAALSGRLRSVRTSDGWLLDADIPVSKPDAPSVVLPDDPS